MGIPNRDDKKLLDEIFYERLKNDRHIIEKIDPLVIENRYIQQKDFIYTQQLFFSFYRTPGETRLKNKECLIWGIEEGVEKGIFGLGELE